MVASNTHVQLNDQVGSRSNAQGTMLRQIAISFLIAAPFLGAGAYGFARSELPIWAALVVFLVGVLLAVVGLVSVGRVIPPLSLVSGEELLVSRHPTMRPAFARMVLSAPFSVGAWYMFEFTLTPLRVPVSALSGWPILVLQGLQALPAKPAHHLHSHRPAGGTAVPFPVVKHQGDPRGQNHFHLGIAQLF
jgi:hypothetical protein